MARRKLESYPAPGYPDLGEVTCDRRRFLRRAAIGAISLGVGGRILAACTSTTSIEGTGTPGPDPIEVRIPETGFVGTTIYSDDWGMEQDYLLWAIRLTTYDADLASWFREHRDEAVALVASTLDRRRCTAIGDASTRAAIEADIESDLEDHYISHVAESSSLIDSIELIVDRCDTSWVEGGVAPWPEDP